jgi:Tol biopolymer transport system component
MKPQRTLVASFASFAPVAAAVAVAVAAALALTGCDPSPSPAPEAGGKAGSAPPPPPATPAKPPEPPRQLIADAWKASWAPDGQRLAVGRGPGQGIEIYDLGTRTRTPLTPTGKDPAWSPDGRFIAHVREPEHNAYQAEETWVIAPDGTGARRVGTGGFPSWSGDGKLLIVHERTRNRMVAYQAARLEAEPTVYCERALSWYPGVSPDGTNLAFGIAGQLVVVDRTTGRLVASRPTPNDGGLLPAWSPDGKLVAFGGFDSSQLGLCVFEVATGKAARIAAGNFTMPAWSADGRRMAFDNRAGDREVWVVDRDFVDARLRDPAAALSRTAAPTPEAPAERPADTTSLQGQPAPGSNWTRSRATKSGWPT